MNKFIGKARIGFAVSVIVMQVVFAGGSNLINISYAQTADDSAVQSTDASAPSMDVTASTDTSVTTVTTDTTVAPDATTDTTSATTGDTSGTSGADVVTTDTSAPTTETITTDSSPAPPVQSPTLSTDQADYNPGQTASIFGNFFQALQNIVLKIFGYGADGTTEYTESTQNITADSNGAFTTTYTLDGTYRPTYSVTANSTTDGTQLAQTTFTDTPTNIGYDKSGYDKGAATWGTGNQSGYSENDWVQYQYTVTGITAAVPNFNVEYDEQISNVIFIDGFSNFRVCVDCAVTGSSNSRLPDGTARPASEGPAGTGNWHAFTPTGTINATYDAGAHTCSTTDPANSPSAQHCFRIDPVTIHAANSEFPASFSSGVHTVTIFYEAHMAASYVWSTGHEDKLRCQDPVSPVASSIYCAFAPAGAVPANTTYGTAIYSGWNTTSFKGAGGINGASKHFNLQDQSAGANGSIALPIPAVTLPAGAITITKVTNPTPATGVSFPFTSDFGSFTLDTDPSATNSSTITFGSLPAGTFNFTETQPVVSGWTLKSISCVTTGGTAGSTFVTSTVSGLSTVSLASGGIVTCTYTNAINQVSPTVVTAIHDATHSVVTSVPAGTTVHDSVSVTGSNGTATGNVTFAWFTNGTCTVPTSTTSGSVALSGGIADATAFPQGPLNVGNYSFKAHYSGDSNYFAGDSSCEPLTVTKVSPTIATTLVPPGPVAIGAAVHDTSALSGATATAGGSVTYTVYTNNTCTATSTTAGTKTVTNGVVPDSDPVTFNSAGTFYWQAAYSGDTGNNAAVSGCQTETLVVNPNTPSISTTLSSSSIAIGTSIHDSSVLSGATATAGGTVTYHAYAGANTCSGTDLLNSTKTVTNGVVPDSANISFANAGTYSFQATYSGDVNNAGPVSSVCSTEQLVVNKSTPSPTTDTRNASGISGLTFAASTTVHDTATITGSVGTPTGSVVFDYFTNGTCSAPTSSTSAAIPLVNGFADGTSFAQGPLAAGQYSFLAHYSGDNNYNPSTASCEPFTIVDASIVLSPLAATNAVGANHVITVTVNQNDGTGVTPAPNGTLVTFSLVNSNGATASFVGGNTCTTTGGTCTVTINSPTAGSVAIHATTTFLVGGVSLTRATGDGLSTDSADAHKTYVDLQIKIDANSTNEINNSHTFTVTVKSDPGTGIFGAVSGATVTPGITGTGSLTGTGTCETGTTDVNGQCTIIVNSATPGTGTVSAATTVIVGGVSITRSLGDSLSGDSAKATKTWVDASITLSPLTATNNVNAPHTITATVTKDPGTGSVPASGVLVTFSLLNNTAGAAFVGGVNTCTTNVSGQCSVQINSATPGNVDIHATTTFSVGGVSLTRASGDGLSGDSANANKVYVAGKITIVKDAQPNDLIDFPFTGTAPLGNFLLDDDAGVADKGLNGDIDQSNSKASGFIAPGTYTVTETEPNSFWTFGGVTCVTTGTATPYTNITTSTTGVAINLAAGDDVTCTFVNIKQSPTRTLGFWQTHTAYTSGVFAAAPISSSMPIGSGIHKGFITTVNQLFGAFYSSIPKTSTGSQRNALDKARMVLLQQLVAAKLNCANFGCSAAIQTQISNADSVYATGTAAQILAAASQLDTYNNSGDTLTIGPAGSATPSISKLLADLLFWNTP